MDEKYIYVIFSKTNCKIGSAIRLITREKYNHVSISLDDTFKKLYSFARYYKTSPFYAGFTEESPLRYNINNKNAGIKIYKVPVTKKEYQIIRNHIKHMKANKKTYIYNFLSAATFPFRKKVMISGSYTCIEFALYLLSKKENTKIIKKDEFYSIKDLGKILDKYLMYEGTSNGIFKNKHKWGNDKFLEKKNPFFNVSILFIEIVILIKRIIYKTNY